MNLSYIKDKDSLWQSLCLFIAAFEDYRQEFKKSFPMMDEIKCFIRKPNAIEDLVKYAALVLG